MGAHSLHDTVSHSVQSVPVGCFFWSSNKSAELIDELPESLSSRALASYYKGIEKKQHSNSILSSSKVMAGNKWDYRYSFRTHKPPKADHSESCSHFVVFTWLRWCEPVIISTHFWVDPRVTFTTAPPRGLLTVRHPKKGDCWEGRGELTTQELKPTEKCEMQWLGRIKKKHCS